MGKKSKFLFGAGLTVAAAAISALATRKISKTMVGEALDREEPKGIKNIADNVFDSYAQKEPYLSALPLVDVLLNTENEEIEISASDGTKLVAHYIKSKKPKRIILAMHGWRSTWARDFAPFASFWQENNCDVLYVEERGQGKSGGDYMTFGLAERYDCIDWINYLIENKDNLPIYLMGISMGASSVLMASGLDLPERVHGIIADCGYTSPDNIFKHVIKKTLHVPYSVNKPSIENYCKEKISAGASEFSTVEALENNKTPVLFVHGSDDTFVPVEMTYENYKACAAPKTLFIVPGADHGVSMLIDPDGYKKHFLDFFKKYDK